MDTDKNGHTDTPTVRTASKNSSAIPRDKSGSMISCNMENSSRHPDDHHNEPRQSRTRMEAPSQYEIPVSKAGQLEAAALDAELSEMLKDQLNRVLAFFRPSLMTDLQPELDAAFRALVFYFSVWTNNLSPGNMFQNLVYVDGRPSFKADAYDLQGRPLSIRQRCLHACFFVLSPWIWARINRYISANEWGARPDHDRRRRLWLTFQRCEALYKCASLINFALFLINGRYRCLGDRLLRIRLLHMDPMRSRTLNFEYMNQLLVWQSLLQFLSFLKPLVSSATVRDWLASAWPWRQPAGDAAAAAELRAGQCPICRAEPINSPHAGDCGHTYCYYCLKSALLHAGPARRFACVRCRAYITACRRVSSITAPAPPPAVAAAALAPPAAGEAAAVSPGRDPP